MQNGLATGPVYIALGLNGHRSFISGVSPAMTAFENMLAEIAVTNIPVLLTGEVGTGKETFARRLHELSVHHSAAFSRVACASAEAATFPLGLAGNGSGENGTILFDEITELDTACQRRLVNALPDGEVIQRPGCISARIVSTTSRNLDDEVRSGRFRSDLFYRINGACLRLPPLRYRREDIDVLAEGFLTKHALQLGRKRPSLSARARQTMFNYSWPGNIRELENVVKKIVALNDEAVVLAELEETLSNHKEAIIAEPSHSLKAAARAASREAERELILKALARTRWNRKRAAQELQISYKSLLYKLKQIGLEESEKN